VLTFLSSQTGVVDLARNKIVIIGGVATGPKAAARARRIDPDADITIIDKGELFSYAGCGMSFYIEGLIEDVKELMCTPLGVVRDESFFKNTKNVKVLGKTEAIKINRNAKKITVKNLKTDEIQDIGYDKLILATGAYPVTPPIEGIDLAKVYQLNNLKDARAIRETLEKGANEIVIIGAGLIGLETCGAFISRGCKVTIVEILDQILPGLLDSTMAALLTNYLKDKGVEVLVSEKVTKIEGDEQGYVKKVITDKNEINADMIIVAVGVRPEAKLAKEAGVKLGDMGGILVNEYLQTNDPNIYAGGDCVENLNLITGINSYVPMGSTANKHGRVIGDNITGGKTTFPGITGTVVFKILDYNIGKTGLNEKQAIDLGYEPITCIRPSSDCAHYHPSTKPFIIKLIVDHKTGKILGGQGLGAGEVVKRIDTLATAIKFGATVKDLVDIDLGYAPPYSTAIDAIAHAANIIRNKIEGLAQGISPIELKEKIERNDDFILLDVRTKKEIEKKIFKDKRVNWIPLGSLQDKLNQLPKGKEIIIYCQSSLRAYEAQRIIEGKGFKDVKFLDGGLLAWPYDL
jgi:NADPH-dependent 2,4-dienoyl-CoA reductase/sulfur reductase-like enzyme/rhodanese-related sulfurtransferase